MTNAGHGLKPSNICTTHLNSCHAEIHQEIAYIKRYGPRSNHLGHVALGQFIPENIEGRHEELAHELDFRAKQSQSRNGHSSSIETRFKCVDAELFGFPLKALQLYQKNVFRCKDCNCLER